jgi:hypothetical protein
MIGAADIDGFIPEACELIQRKIQRKTGADDRDPASGTVDAERFEFWVEHRLLPILRSFAQGEKRSIVVMDNASVHGSCRLNDLITSVGAILIYQSTYSPDLNPIEKCFHQYKAFLKRCYWMQQRGAYVQHMRALYSVTRENMCNYYRALGVMRNVPPPAVAPDPTEILTLAIAAAQTITAAASFLLRHK